MTLTDPIADMLTRMRNALMAHHEEVVLPSSGIKEDIARVMMEEGFIRGYDVFMDGAQKKMRIALKYTEDRQSVLQGLKRVSTPGRRVYVRRDDIPRVKGGMGFAIMSTSRGLMTGEDAWRAGVGGEVLCFLW